MTVKPFQLNVPQAVLDDLQERLAMTRWPEGAEGSGWERGTSLAYLKELVDDWQHRYNWREQEAALNRFHWFEAEVDGQPVRFIHECGKGPNPTPIILFHGWPDSVLRYLKLIPMLTDPARFGGDPNDSFDVIVYDQIDPTVNGKVQVRAQGLRQTAERGWKLMTQELGYRRFAAGGGDGGSPLAQHLAVDHPESIIGLHLTDIGFSANNAGHTDLSEVEQQYLEASQALGFQESAYAMVQGTIPQTLAYGLTDSPTGLAGWIIEKFRTWSDCGGNLESLYTKDELLTNIMFYWVRGFDPRGYREEWGRPSLKPDQAVHVPVGLAQPPRDITPVTPREYAERNLKDLRRSTVLERGGHFAAMEFPALVAEDLRAFFHELKG